MIRTAILTVALALIAVAICSDAVSAQKQAKPWTEWSKKDAEKILKDSPWSHMQTDTDTAEMFYHRRPRIARAPNARRGRKRSNRSKYKRAVWHSHIFSQADPAGFCG